MRTLPRDRRGPRTAAVVGARGRGVVTASLATTLAATLALTGCGVLGTDAPPGDATTTGHDDSGVGVRGGDGGQDGQTGREPADGTPLPTFDPGTAVGAYADGFPRELLGAPEDATVLASSATPRDDALTDVTLNLSTPRSTQEVIDQLAERLREAGFKESGTSTVSGLTAQTTFGREATPKGKKGAGPVMESVTLGVLDDGERRLVSVSGSLVAG
ncbi:hypothetical protein M1843_06250 [Isoptericola sp. 4D.3]|uniref:Lipoprotein n=1 Tax=Isoptericola peretonis TaxID=2918523 RepID=A0ABT0J1R1_9MICO|nr:hypothetical protein [Isoptericola sp. 4D.3]